VETITAERIVELFEKDRAALKRFAALVVSEDEVRLALVSAVLRDVATRDYVDRKFGEMHDYVDKRFSEMREYVDRRFAELREYVDKRFSELKDYVDKRFSELREYVDGRFSEMRDYVDRGFSELRRDIGELRDRVSSLEVRVSRVEGQLALLIRIFLGLMIPILVALVGILLKLVFMS